jgi:hypothetical protein
LDKSTFGKGGAKSTFHKGAAKCKGTTKTVCIFIFYLRISYMCWNKDVSIKTFIFTTIVMVLIWTSKHKSQLFDSIFAYLFIFSFSLMQLVEYFIWTSIETRNVELNQIASVFGWLLIRVAQPIAALYLLPESYTYLRNILLPTYIASLIGTTAYKSMYNPIQFKTIVGKNSHLEWLWNDLQGFEINNVLMYFICIGTLFIRFPIGVIGAMLLLLFSVLYYNNTWGSNWCYLVNAIVLYFFAEWFWLNIKLKN